MEEVFLHHFIIDGTIEEYSVIFPSGGKLIIINITIITPTVIAVITVTPTTIHSTTGPTGIVTSSGGSRKTIRIKANYKGVIPLLCTG